MGGDGALGGPEAWGVGRPFPDEEFHLHQGEFVERLLVHTLPMLNKLIAATPVERLAGMDAGRERPFPVRPLTDHETRALWQLGF